MPEPRTFLQGLVGVFGFPVAENPTQAMLEPAFESLGLDWRYLTVEVQPESLGDAVRSARAMGWKGFNCTIPHKQAVMAFLDEISPAAEMIGAVNCVTIRDGRTLGDNTDGKGFLLSLEAVCPVAGMRAVIFGAGGAARAIGTELALGGAAHLTIVNRTPNRGRELAESLRRRTGVPTESVSWVGDYRVPCHTRLVINAKSIGLYPNVEDCVPLDRSTLLPEMIVCDVIPNPPRTKLLDMAEQGCTTLDGLGMLISQGVIGLRMWCGLNADPKAMRESLEAALGISQRDGMII